MISSVRFFVVSLFLVGGMVEGALSVEPTAGKKPEPASVAGQVQEVTLYHGQAMITRTIPLDGAKGGQEVVVSPLPEQIVPQSLFAEGSDGVEIRAVRFRCRAVGEEPREEVRKLDEAIDKLTEQLQTLERQRQVVARQNTYLDGMDNFVLPTMKSDLSRGVLNATALEKLTQLSFTRREDLAKKIGELEKAVKDTNKQLSLRQRERAELTAGSRKAVREALVFVDKPNDGNESFRLSYLVGACSWSPSYTIRAGKDRKKIAVECNAVITQMTGEDWTGVKLTLSTASPALSAAGPGLAPLPIALTRVNPTSGNKWDVAELNERARNIQGQKAEAAKQNRNVFSVEESLGSGWQLNAAAGDFQTLELAIGKDMLASVVNTADAEGPSLCYQIAHPVSLASRQDQQMVRIMRTDFSGTFYHVATPVLSSFVYREAELKNTGDDDLLAGPITAYLDGRFVGRGEIPTVARGQTFVVGFGADPQLRARRELVDRTEVVQGGNRELSFKYRLVIENFKQEAASLRLFDRAPYSDRPTEVRIKLGEMKDPLSTDSLYVRTEKPKNILRWDLTVPASTTAEKARLVEYGFTIEFDRNLTVGLPQLSAAGEPVPAEQEVSADEKMQSVGFGGMNQPSSAPQQARPRKPAASQPSAPNANFQQFQQMQRHKLAH